VVKCGLFLVKTKDDIERYEYENGHVDNVSKV